MKILLKTLSIIFCIFSPAISSFAEQPAANETMKQLSLSAGQELAKSIQELNQLREQIATEKLPLAQELTTLEEKLTQLRRGYENATRKVDDGNLEIITIKA